MYYNKTNNLLGWLCFIIASCTYILTLEPSVSFWDCGEFIACAYRLQVSHQPGYPLFAMICKAFSLLSMGDKTKVAYFTNMGCALASGATVTFLFWTITLLAKKMLAGRLYPNANQQPLIFGAGLVGALAFAFSDTFWFSAVETIVFAMSALCTAIVFWAMLRWDASADEPGADKWIVFIAYVIGLSIGIHLLNLLTIPALALIWYFRRHKNINFKSAIVAFAAGILILAFVQFGVRGYTVMVAAYFDLFFVNTLGMGFGSGALVFFVLLVGVLVAGIRYSIRKGKPALHLAFLCITFIYFGYSSFVYIPIRAAANTDLNNSHPDNAFTLYGYLNRIQYPQMPLLSGPYFDAKVTDQVNGAPIYQRGGGKYIVAGHQLVDTYDHTTILPRIHSQEPGDPAFYRQWLQLPDSASPTFADNMKYMFSWQIYQMYARYFLWNFAGRYNNEDGQYQMGGFHGYADGDWTTGIFDETKHLPKSLLHDNSYTPLYALPLVLGLIGLYYHSKRSKRDAIVVGMLWLFTGLAIVFYVNQPLQPRERDYSYVGSFYAFAIWIGLGVIGIAVIFQRAVKKLDVKTVSLATIVLCLLIAPVLMARQEWRAHDRSTKMTPHDMAYNYLISCPKNAILFTGSDNDTYSLWYDQEVEGIRPDVRIVITTLFSGDWYIRQHQQLKMNESDPLPITMSYDKYRSGTRDFIPYSDAHLPDSIELKDVFDFITSEDSRTKVEMQDGEVMNYLPTKNFKLTVNKDDVIKNGVVPANQQNKVADKMEWKFSGNYLGKDNLAFMDILVHNNWKRPICFTSTMPEKDLEGLQQYLYKEGFVYHLMPLKPELADPHQPKINTTAMYDNVVNKFKYGKFKTAKNLDEQSKDLFYPMITSTYVELAQSLMSEGHNDLALKALRKYNQEIPDIYPNNNSLQGKYWIIDTALRLHDTSTSNKYLASADKYLVDQLDYSYNLLQSSPDDVNASNVQYELSMLNGIAGLSKQYNQAEYAGKLQDQMDDYSKKFKDIMQR
jgi:hypothetical protein